MEITFTKESQIWEVGNRVDIREHASKLLA